MSNTEASLEGSFSPPLTDSQNSTAAGASSQVNKSKGTSVKQKAMAPRQKLNYLEFALIEMYNAEKSSEVMQKLKDTLFELYDEYKPQVSSDRGQSSVEKHTPSSEPQQKVKRRMKDLYKRRVAENGDYIRNSSTEEEIKKIEEQIEELDKIDNDLSWNALEPTLNS
ncbi:hypothetical protein V6N13_072794 [Hibiscus sabdariffa]